MIVALSARAQVVAAIVVWAGWGTAMGYLTHRLPPQWLGVDRGPLRLCAAEHEGRFYRHIAIRRWKSWLPEAGGLFAGGFSKRRLRGRDDAYLERFVVETRRARSPTSWCSPSPRCSSCGAGGTSRS